MIIINNTDQGLRVIIDGQIFSLNLTIEEAEDLALKIGFALQDRRVLC